MSVGSIESHAYVVSSQNRAYRALELLAEVFHIARELECGDEVLEKIREAYEGMLEVKRGKYQ